eukprot:TRINITY_DN7228_c0_g1_i1.p1 TRINITY_DN7228_c0_g1~~TRINITY_DN7228_c0_g1_i1.p1  ORF type:complete len:495 (-),score=132.31 TRINITY_DN7228_c0_g1_i1:123-1547(-)
MMKQFHSSGRARDVTIIGGGPGGYVAALRAAQLGMKVTCVEKEHIGGTCLNVGCIPSKCLLNSSHHYHEVTHELPRLGVRAEKVNVDVAAMMRHKQTTLTSLRDGIEQLFAKNKVEYVRGEASIAGPHAAAVKISSGERMILDTENIIVASGSVSANLPFIKIDEERVVTSTGALSLKTVPKRMIVIGAGVIGLELGSVWSRLGSQVTFIEYLDRVAPGSDMAVSRALKRILEQQKMKFQMQTKVTGVDTSGKDIIVTAQQNTDGKQLKFAADVLMVAVGRKPQTDGLGLKEMHIETDRAGRIVVNADLQTAVPSVYAIGDVIKGPMLAHKASEEGFALVERLAGLRSHVNYDAIPSVVYTTPEAAWVGITEQEARAAHRPVRVGQFQMRACSRARCVAQTEGFVKIIADAASDRVIGAHIVASCAGEMVHEATVAVETGMTSEAFARVCHAHPTLSEAVKEAALGVRGKPIHS